jgi:Ca2+-binding EF-hand superfamily protein
VPTKKQIDEAEKAFAKVDWAKLDAMTDEEIEAAARSDPDNPPLTDEELKNLRPVRKTRRGPEAAE